MGKRSQTTTDTHVESPKSSELFATRILSEENTIDPSLALLFASSGGPVAAPSRSRYHEAPPTSKRPQPEKQAVSNDNDISSDEDGDDEVLSSLAEGSDVSDDGTASVSASRRIESLAGVESTQVDSSKLHSEKPRKRRRLTEEDDIEGRYMSQLAREEEAEEIKLRDDRQQKRQRILAESGSGISESDDVDSSGSEGATVVTQKDMSALPADVPQHETLENSSKTSDVEKASRTVFLANVATTCITDKKAKKALLEHMSSFLSELATPKDDNMKHRVESIRFRSTAYAGSGLPKKAAFATKSIMDATTKSTNAYVVYTNAFAAREAVKRLNGTMVLDRHLRVDGVAHPSKVDHRRCVFVGNLGFVDDESMMDENGENQRKRSKIPSDVEEGLWRQFSKVGVVESVRVIRDEKTRVGKGFAYVQFQDANAVEAALLFEGKKFPPMLPRILRVTRAKAVKKTANAEQHIKDVRRQQSRSSNNPNNPNHTRIYNPKINSQQQSLEGRAGKLLGRAGAAQFKARKDPSEPRSRGRTALEGIAKAPETIVFEGYRASAKSGRPKDLKFGAKSGKKKQGKPGTRSSRRGSEWKKSGGKKA